MTKKAFSRVFLGNITALKLRQYLKNTPFLEIVDQKWNPNDLILL